MASLISRSVRSVLVLSVLAAAAACSDAAAGISAVEPGAAVAAKAAGGSPGDVTATSYTCGNYGGVGHWISPYCFGGPFGGFQSTAGTGSQSSITITFANPATSVSLTALDPDYYGNSIAAYDANWGFIDFELFDYDGVPGNIPTNTSRKTVSGYGIKFVVLTPNSSDYIAYDNLSFY